MITGYEQIEEDSLKYSDEPVKIRRYESDIVISLTPRGVFKLACMGWTGTEIASIHGLPQRTFMEHFSDVVREGKYSIASRLRQHLLHHIFTSEKPDAALFKLALKNMAGFTEDGKNLDTNEDNKPNQLNVTLRVLKKNEQSG